MLLIYHRALEKRFGDLFTEIFLRLHDLALVLPKPEENNSLGVLGAIMILCQNLMLDGLDLTPNISYE